MLVQFLTDKYMKRCYMIMLWSNKHIFNVNLKGLRFTNVDKKPCHQCLISSHCLPFTCNIDVIQKYIIIYCSRWNAWLTSRGFDDNVISGYWFRTEQIEKPIKISKKACNWELTKIHHKPQNRYANYFIMWWLINGWIVVGCVVLTSIPKWSSGSETTHIPSHD